MNIFFERRKNIHQKEGFDIKKSLTLLFVVLAVMIIPVETYAKPQEESQEAKYPCSLILNAKQNMPINAKGVALAYRITNDIGSERTSLSIHAQYLPDPSTLGNYDRYEGFAQVPGVISWRFILYPTPEPEVPTWAGRIDDISGPLERASIQIRLSDSRTNTLGPIVLENHMNNCK